MFQDTESKHFKAEDVKKIVNQKVIRLKEVCP